MAIEASKEMKVHRVAILVRFDDESLGVIIGKDSPNQYTNSLLVWDLEQTKIGLFQGCFEEE